MSLRLESIRHLYPFEGYFLNIDGLRYHYVDEGSGEPVVMLHGNPTWSFFFRNLILGLRESFRAIAPDHIGCGLSDKPDDNHYNYTLARRVADLERLIGALELGNDLTLVMHDWGGAIGMVWAARNPHRVKRLVLMNTAAFRNPNGRKIPALLALSRRRMLGSLLIRGANAFAAGTARLGCAQPLPADVRRAYLAPYDSWSNRIATHRFVQDIPLTDSDSSWETLLEAERRLAWFRVIPKLVCWGMQDFVFSRAFLDRWRELYPDAEFRCFEDAGHYLLEDKSDEIVSTVREFLMAHPIHERAS